MKLFLTPLILFMLTQNSFKEDQLKHSRVSAAYKEKEDIVKNYFSAKNLKYQGFHLFIRAFKQEKKLEVWVKEAGKSNYELLTTYDFCATSGMLGPKRREGDGQIPEGVYKINHFNPLSNFHLSLGINYPNKSDLHFADKRHPGQAIYIHGACVTIGCIPITDAKIKELFILAVEARNNGQGEIPVHIFPAKLNAENMSKIKKATSDPLILAFWENLRHVYADFDAQRQLHKVGVNDAGEYAISQTLF
jgi:murein L,D-transpeptidase YafK